MIPTIGIIGGSYCTKGIMAWSSTSLSATEYKGAVREAADNHISAMPSWSVVTTPGFANHRNFQYNMGSKNIYPRTTIEISYNDTYTKFAGMYNENSAASWDLQHQQGVSSGMSPYNPSTGHNYKIWTNTALPDSFMIVADDGSVVWAWFECNQYMVMGDPAWNTTPAAMNYTCPLGFNSGSAACGGLPVHDKFNYSVPPWMGFDLCTSNTQPFESAAGAFANGVVVQGIRLMQTTNTNSYDDKHVSVGTINTPEILLQTGSVVNKVFDGPLQKVTDGTNWYLRTNANISAAALLLPVGTSEPTF